MLTKCIFDPCYRQAIAELRAARVRCNMTQAAVAKQLGRQRTWVGKVESCEVRLDIVQFVELCRAYGISASRFILRLEKMEPPV